MKRIQILGYVFLVFALSGCTFGSSLSSYLSSSSTSTSSSEEESSTSSSVASSTESSSSESSSTESSSSESSSSSSSETPLDANRMMLEAMMGMTHMDIGSLDAELIVDANFSQTYDPAANEVGFVYNHMNVVVDANARLKVDDLWALDPIDTAISAELTVNDLAILSQYDEFEGVPIEEMNVTLSDQIARGYYNNGFIYVDITEAPDAKALLNWDEGSPSQFRVEIGRLVDVLGIPPMESLAMSPEDTEEMIGMILPLMDYIPHLTYAMVGTDLIITYEVLEEDLPNLIETVILTMQGIDPETLTPEQIEQLDAMVTMVLSMIDFRTLRIEIHVDTIAAIVNFLEIDVDVVLNIQGEETTYVYNEITSEYDEVLVPFTQTIVADVFVDFELHLFNQEVVVILPSNRDEWWLIQPEQPN